MQVFKGKKKLLMSNQVNTLKARRFQEFNAVWMLAQVKDDAEIREYIPESWFEPQAKVSREFLWTILSSLQPEFASEILNHAVDLRIAEQNNVKEGVPIEICQEMAELISKIPFLSSK
jgi:hypothetical protein